MTDAGVSWAWYSGGWDNAAGNITGRGWTNGAGPTCGDPNSAPAAGRRRRPDAGYPYCPDKSFQHHHQPFAYFARYAPGTPGRAAHLQGREGLPRPGGQTGDLPQGQLRQAARQRERAPRLRQRAERQRPPRRPDQGDPRAGRDGKNTLIVVTYDEFGGQWDHVSPPGMGTRRRARPVRPGHPDPGADRRRRGLNVRRRPHRLRHDVDHGDDRGALRPRAGRPPGRGDPRDGRVAPLTHAIRLGLGKT